MKNVACEAGRSFGEAEASAGEAGPHPRAAPREAEPKAAEGSFGFSRRLRSSLGTFKMRPARPAMKKKKAAAPCAAASTELRVGREALPRL